MSFRLTLKNDQEQLFYCIIAKEEDIEDELEKVFSITKGYGFSVRCSKTSVKIVDYFHGETRASFEIVSLEECEEECIYHLLKLS